MVGRRWDNQQWVQVEFGGEVITRVEPIQPFDGAAVHAHSDHWLAPGLIDLQVNGYRGHDFTSGELSSEHVDQISLGTARSGVTGYLATVTTQAHPVMIHALRTIDAACRHPPQSASRVLGIHLEGPFISSEDGPRGAHPRQHCRLPDWNELEEFQRAAGGRIRLVTIAPELPGAIEMIRRLVACDIGAAIGHTAAASHHIEAAVQAGASLSTHLGNGAHTVLARHPNYLWDQLAEDRLWASLIADGFHLPATVLKVILRAKGAERCLLISDITGMGGRPPGRYTDTSLGDVEVLPDGRLVVAGQRTLLAGAARPLIDGIGHVMSVVGLTLASAWPLASNHPAQVLRIEPGQLAPGRPADLVQFRTVSTAEHAVRLEIERVVCRGCIIQPEPR